MFELTEDLAIQWHERHAQREGCWVCCEKCDPAATTAPNPYYRAALEEIVGQERCTGSGIF